MTPPSSRADALAWVLDFIAEKGPPMALPPPPEPAPNAAWLWLSPIEDLVVSKLAGGVWLTSDQIAERVGEPVTSRLKGILANMVERKILLSENRRGYALNEAYP
jgi:hypothetical protein